MMFPTITDATDRLGNLNLRRHQTPVKIDVEMSWAPP